MTRHEFQIAAWTIASAAAWGDWEGTSGSDYVNRNVARRRIEAEILRLIKIAQDLDKKNEKL